MATAKIAGKHGSVYEAFFKQADTKGTGIIEAMDAANFMKQFGLSENVLSDIWDLADPGCKGFLDKEAFYTAMKLIALVQNHHEPSILNLHNIMPPPIMATHGAGPNSPGLSLGPPISFPAPPPPPPPVEWAITSEEKAKYDQIFNGLGPVNGLLPGDKVRPVLMNSKLPMDLLVRVWEHSDIDKDGFLDSEEFAVAMHLVYKALEKEPVPMLLPQNLIPLSKRKKIPGQATSVAATAPTFTTNSKGFVPSGAAPGVAPTAAWVVTPAEKIQFDEMFKKADQDLDGFVNGLEIKNIFLQSGVPQSVLAHIWNLCDTQCVGKLNTEQFALAMWLVQQKVAGIDPPPTLSPEMVPPSLRPPVTAGDAPPSNVVDPNSSGMMELDMITKDIEKLKVQKMELEQEKAQKDADMRIRNGDVASQQKELDAINATVKQLESQKGNAQKRLDDLDDKKSKLDNDVKGLQEKHEEEMKEIAELRNKLDNQETLQQTQEAEMERKKEELNELRTEETKLEQEVDDAHNQLDMLMHSLADAQAFIESHRLDVERLEKDIPEFEEHIKQYNGLLNDDPEARDPEAVAGDAFASNGDADPFQDADPFANSEDPFKGSDPFASSGDPFGASDPFSGSAAKPGSKQSSVDGLHDVFGGGAANKTKDDPFSNDPFANAFNSKSKGALSSDPFGSAFGGNTNMSQNLASPVNPSDPFGTDPWPATSSSDSLGGGKKTAPARPRSKSPALLGMRPGAPSLPPKQKPKAPAPPRPGGPPSRPPAPKPKASPSSGTAPSDPFGSDPFGGSADPFGGDGFASFSPSKFESNDAWATMGSSSQVDSKEQERRRKQEEEDYQLALKLSQQAS